MMASLQLTSMIFSSLSGKFMEFFKSFNLIIYLGYGFWTLGNGLNLLIDIDTKIWKIILIMIIQGIGIGNTLQPTIIAIQSVSDRKDRALILSVRNVLRALGNSISISISSLIYTNSLIKSINSNEGQQLPQNLQNYIILNAYGQPDLNKFNSIELKIFQKLIMKSINNIFIFWIPLTSICLIGSLFIKDKSLDYDDENQEVEQEEDEEEEDVEVIVENISIKDKEVIKPIEK
ncbi:hypothetical protein WICMUC_000146 [Wickerhamomyces mucosus]|uniref:Major facilitator superfamily (MFS) profile domain-containing protein n=1 Tax=Wickerhamomyces mucosus TaxID=1378264 RepID=A0A9P8TJC2_9ASCO|nr:hypothetical protein WICMUC_000146 [Wickerhamomyces mucosus]